MLKMFGGLSTLKLIGYGLGALALIGLLLTINGWRTERNRLRVQVAATCDATREAAANPKLDCKRMPEQIRLLGKSIADLKAAIATQNAAVDALGRKSAADQAAAAKASLRAATRAREAEATAERLRASARAGGAVSGSAGQCKPSKLVEELWK